MKLPIRQRRRLAWLALLLAASGMLLLVSAAQAAGHRGAVLVKDINPGHSPSVTSISCDECNPPYNGGELTDVRGTLYFSAKDGKHGFELWRSDGTRQGTRMVKDINPGRGWSNLSGITTVNRIAYFTADDGVHGAELWRTDGTALGTRMVKDINPGPASGGPGELTDVNGTLYFRASDGHDYALWRSDGTEAGTTVVKTVSASDLTDFHGALYFAAPGGLWRSDGTEAGTTVVKTVPAGDLTVVDGILYFAAGDGAQGTELWRSDGTEAGTILLKAIFPFGLTGVKGIAYFSDTLRLWRSNGTEAGTAVVRVNMPGVKNSIIFPGHLTAVGHTLYFTGADKRHGQLGVGGGELWRSDGTRAGTTMVRDIHRGKSGSDPQNLTAVGDTLFFTAKDGRHGRELWRAGPKPCKTAKGKCKKG